MKKKRYLLSLCAAVISSIVIVALWASQATSTRHPVTHTSLGEASNRDALVKSLNRGKKVSLMIIESADWSVPLSGLLNLGNPIAKQAALSDREEPIQIYTYHIQHPVFGHYLVDTGVSEKLINNPEAFDVPGWLEPQLGFDKLDITYTTEQIITSLDAPLNGVFVTHLHLDHIAGMPAINKDVPIYVGKGESNEKYILYAATRGIVDALLKGRPTLNEWQANYVDIFKDGSVFAIHSPGHTAGSTAYLINSTEGPVLLAGDVSHTAWGWNNQVEPGKFSINKPRSRDSLLSLVDLVEENPQIAVRPGHQKL